MNRGSVPSGFGILHRLNRGPFSADPSDVYGPSELAELALGRFSGVHHDPSGTLRAVALFDLAGEHEPSHPGPWRTTLRELTGEETAVHLADLGVHVRGPANLPVVQPAP
jgi:hypothetical protein